MATMETQVENGAPADLAGQLRNADLARVVSKADGDGLAAAAILGRACAELGLPRHVSVSPTREAAAVRLEGAGTAVALGFDDLNEGCRGDSAALCAYETAEALGATPEPGLALAGAVAAGVSPQGAALEAAKEAGLERRAGLAVPTSDITAGLAYTGLVHADFSGDEAATQAFLDGLDLPDELDSEGRKTLASAVGLEVTDGPTSERAIELLERALGPAESPGAFATIGGYADVLTAAANADPGAGLVALLGDVAEDDLLELWQIYGTALHEAVADLPAGGDGPVTATVRDVSPLDVTRLGHAYSVDADRLYVGDSDAIALGTSVEDARALLATQFQDESVSGTPDLATVATDDEIESVVETIEAAV